MIFSEYEKYTEWKKEAWEKGRKINIIALDEWLGYGGLISYVETKNGVELYTGEDAEADYCDWIKEEKLEDTIENEKEFCKSALEYANVPNDVIEELMENW